LPNVSTLVTTDLVARAKPDELDRVADPHLAALDRARDDRAPAADGQRVLHRHQERRVHVALGYRHVGVDGVEQGKNGPDPPLLTRQRRQPGDPHHRHLLTRVPVGGEQLADLKLDELRDLLVGRVGLVERDDDVRHPQLPGEHDVLPGLRHHAVEGRDHEHRAVDLRRAGDHVLHVVRVARHVHVRVVPGRGLVLDVRDVDCDPARGLLRGAVDLPERHVAAHAAVSEDLRDGGGERGLSVVHVPHRADVEMRLVADVRVLGHD
jgi:hypothetical protein